MAFIGCTGDLEGAARAMVGAAASGDTEAFTAGLSVGAATITGAKRSRVLLAMGCAVGGVSEKRLGNANCS